LQIRELIHNALLLRILHNNERLVSINKCTYCTYCGCVALKAKAWEPTEDNPTPWRGPTIIVGELCLFAGWPNGPGGAGASGGTDDAGGSPAQTPEACAGTQLPICANLPLLTRTRYMYSFICCVQQIILHYKVAVPP
jgi:hypothetical protein